MTYQEFNIYDNVGTSRQILFDLSTNFIDTSIYHVYIYDIPYLSLVNNPTDILYYPSTYPGYLEDPSNGNAIIPIDETEISGNTVNYVWPGEPYYGSSIFSYILQDKTDNAQIIWNRFKDDLSSDPRSIMLFRFLEAQCQNLIKY